MEIKITHCGICHSDLSMLDNDWGMSQFPLVPGHEAVGTVLALGENAKGLKVGQRVGVGWTAYSCLSCRECLSGHHNLCATSQGTIVGRHGGFADPLRAQWTWVRRIPDALDLAKAGPLLCGGVTVFNPFLAYDISPTARVGIIGIGGSRRCNVRSTSSRLRASGVGGGAGSPNDRRRIAKSQRKRSTLPVNAQPVEPSAAIAQNRLRPAATAGVRPPTSAAVRQIFTRPSKEAVARHEPSGDTPKPRTPLSCPLNALIRFPDAAS